MSFEPDSNDVVIREIARLKRLIESDTTAPQKVRTELLERLAVERSSYEAWLTRYASYFREPRTWELELAPMPSESCRPDRHDLNPTPAELPRVEVFADFGGFSHRISYPKGVSASNVPTNTGPMIPSNLYTYMEDWASEFHRHAWDDAMRGKHGTMLWVPFDLQGMSIARAIKLCVGDAARVFYLKPSEDPFACYDYARELLSHGEVLSEGYPAPGHPQEARPEVIDLSLLEPDPHATIKTIRLRVKNNALYFPFGGIDFDKPGYPCSSELPSILNRLYPTGDYDTIPWPIPEFRHDERLKTLAYALYQERKWNEFYTRDVVIELPDGTVFDVRSHLLDQ